MTTKKTTSKDFRNSREVWKDVPGLEGTYQISSLKRVRSLPRTHLHQSTAGKILQPRATKKGELHIWVTTNGLKTKIEIDKEWGTLF